MGKLMPPLCYFYLLYLIFITTFSVLMLVNSLTLDFDTEVLRLIKRVIDPNSVPASSYLSTWEFAFVHAPSGGGCGCWWGWEEEFQGILCSFTLDNSPSKITSIELDGSGYEGFITPSIGNLTELTIINLSKNHFRGPIPDTISELKKLTRLSLSCNFLIGNLPKRLTALKMLQSLDVSYNQLSGSIPPSISGLMSLTYLSMSNNGFTSIIPEISGLWQLRTLDLSRNNLYGRMPNVPLGLRKLMLSHSLLSGHLPALNKLKRLQLLDVSDYKLSGTNTRDIFTLPNLTELNVSINTFTTLEVVRFLGPETQLQVLDAEGNKLRGHLPLNLVTLPNLTSINLSYNQFFGVIRGEFGAKVGAWRILYLDHNFLQGKLPQEFILGPKTIRGSLSNNCLKCPENLPICFGGQKKISECSGHNDTGG